MPKPSKQSIIDIFTKDIELGKSRGEVLSKAVKKWQFSDRTFDRYWKIANQQHALVQKLAKEAADLSYIEASAEAAKKAVMSKAERMEVLSKIGRGELTQKVRDEESGEVNEVFIPVVPNDRKAAIAELNKMEGDYAPTKTELTGKNGAPLNGSIDFSKYSDEELRTIAALQHKGRAGEKELS